MEWGILRKERNIQEAGGNREGAFIAWNRRTDLKNLAKRRGY